MEEGAAFIISDILADPVARAITFGLASPLATPYRASVKTGTSKDMRDNWTVGYTARHTVAVWVGNFSGAPMHDVSGVTGAAPVWRDVVDFLGSPAMTRRSLPSGVVRHAVRFDPPLEPDREELFLAGTEIATVTAIAAPTGRARFESPADGSIYALDPDIPNARQRVAVRARGASPGARFVFADGRSADATESLLWDPSRGRHRIALLDEAGREVDRVSFEVR
jgi:penicillin-binding protein 1C